MKKMLLGTAVAAFGVVGTAIAADMPTKARPMEPAPVRMSWTGCYVGLGGGYGMWNQDNETLAGGAGIGDGHTDGGRGWFGTAQVGCDYQFAPKWVIGAFGDVDFGSLKGSMNLPSLAFTGDERERWSWAVGGRAGYLPFDPLLVYVSGGFTAARFDQVDLRVGAAAVGLDVPATTYNGWFLGSGFEYKLDWLPGLFWKTEYRFADYGSKTNPILVTATGGATGLSVDSHTYIQTVRSELVYRFNWR